MSDTENVIPFRRRPIEPENAPIWITREGEGIVTECEGLIHVFADTPGRCQCGSEWWDGATDPESPPA